MYFGCFALLELGSVLMVFIVYATDLWVTVFGFSWLYFCGVLLAMCCLLMVIDWLLHVV